MLSLIVCALCCDASVAGAGGHGREEYSDEENFDIGDDSSLLRGIYGARFGQTQEPQEPDWMAFGLTDFTGVSQVQENIELAWRPVMQARYELEDVTFKEGSNWCDMQKSP